MSSRFEPRPDRAAGGPVRSKGGHRVRICGVLVPLAGGGVYVCGRHTKDKRGLCQLHRPPPSVKHPPDPIMPRRISESRT